MSLLDRARLLSDDLIAIRRDLHRHPELGFQEVRTAGIIADRLRAMGLEPQTGIGLTGVVADITNGDGPMVALRADMDALPIHEDADHEYSSTVPGLMHACGHDAHVAGLLGTARLLLQEREAGTLPAGTVRLIFQPSEEGEGEDGRSGARRMMDEGALEGVQAIAGLHVGAHMPLGDIQVGGGPVMGGAKEVVVTVRGVSAHAAMPDAGIDALVLAAQGITAVQTGVSRRIGPTEAGVITFGKIAGGTAHNIIADEIVISGTFRYFTQRVHDRLVETLNGAFKGLEAQGASVQVDISTGYPPVVNDPTQSLMLANGLREIFGDQIVDQPPWLGGEDFSFYTQHLPGTFMWVGSALPEPREHHHPRFDIDERAITTGATVLAKSAVEMLKAQR